jgi:transposase InsO family protein
MRIYHPENERLKRLYLQHLKHRRGASEASLDRIVAAIDRYQRLTQGKPFRKFHREQVVAFKRTYDGEKNTKTGKALGASTRRAELHALKGFFLWLSDQPGFKRRITYGDAEYFNLDNRSRALANDFRNELAWNGIACSMSSTGNCYDCEYAIAA